MIFGVFAAWVQVSQGSETVSVAFRTGDGEFVRGGSVVAEQGCWSLLKGGIAANSSSTADVYFEVKGIQLSITSTSESLKSCKTRVLGIC